MKNKKEISRLKRHTRIRMRMRGSAQKPRLVVRRSINNIFAEVVDDAVNKTLVAASTLDKEVKQKFPSGGNVKVAFFLGEVFAKRLVEKGIVTIIFDRAGYLYHGRVKSFADGLRKGGLKF